MTQTHRVRLSQLLTPASVNLKLHSNDRDSVLSELVNQVPGFANQPEARETLLRALREREQLHSTGIGDGVALPHARNALVGLVHDPLLVFGRHDTGIPFDAIDQIPARLFFLLLAPTVTMHLAILARLTRLVSDARVRKSLLEADSAEKAIAVIRDAEEKL